MPVDGTTQDILSNIFLKTPVPLYEIADESPLREQTCGEGDFATGINPSGCHLKAFIPAIATAGPEIYPFRPKPTNGRPD